MKKIFILILLMFMGSTIVNAETIDTTSPQINSIELNKTSFKAGEQIKFKINASDDVSGILSIVFEFADVDNYENSLTIPMQGEFINREKTYAGNVPSNARTAEYYLRRVHISVQVINNSCYVIDGLPFNYEDCTLKDFKIPNIKVEATNLLSTPKLENFTYKKI